MRFWKKKKLSESDKKLIRQKIDDLQKTKDWIEHQQKRIKENNIL